MVWVSFYKVPHGVESGCRMFFCVYYFLNYGVLHYVGRKESYVEGSTVISFVC